MAGDNYYSSMLKFKMDRERQDMDIKKAGRLMNNGALNSALKLMEVAGIKIEGPVITQEIANDPEALRQALAPVTNVVFSIMDALIQKIDTTPAVDMGPETGSDPASDNGGTQKAEPEAPKAPETAAQASEPNAPAAETPVSKPAAPAEPERAAQSEPAPQRAIEERPASNSQLSYLKTLWNKAGTPENERVEPKTAKEASGLIEALKRGANEQNGGATPAQTRTLAMLYDRAGTRMEDRQTPKTSTEAQGLITKLVNDSMMNAATRLYTGPEAEFTAGPTA